MMKRMYTFHTNTHTRARVHTHIVLLPTKHSNETAIECVEKFCVTVPRVFAYMFVFPLSRIQPLHI
jgi:hypothetical protein